MDEAVRRGQNLDAFADTPWITIRGDIATYPF